MSKRSKLIWFILDCLILAILMFLTNRLSYKEGYKEGYEECAKDFYKGKVKVDLIENADGTKEWKWIKKQYHQRHL